jgi:hypothetical protein
MKMVFNFTMHVQECRRQELARSGFARIELCSCGSVHLTVGAVTLRLCPTALSGLAHVIDDAVHELTQHSAALRSMRSQMPS